MPAACTGEMTSAPLATVIVPIHDAHTVLCEALASVARETREPCRIVLINDGSRDRRISRLLRSLEAVAPNAVTVDRPDNRGFVHTVNEGFTLAPSGAT